MGASETLFNRRWRTSFRIDAEARREDQFLKFARDLIAYPWVRITLVLVAIPIPLLCIPIAVYGIGESASMLDVTIPSVRALRPLEP